MNIDPQINLLKSYIETENYSGYDPYDGLTSPLFNLPFLKKNKTIRFLSQQFIKRFPINLRSILGIKKGKNPVTLGLCIQAYSYLFEVEPNNKQEYLSKIEQLLNELETLSAKGFSGTCWGYDFDWEARYATIPAYQPTVVATGIITNSLFECWKITENERGKELLIDSSKFVLKDLKRSYKNDTFCFSYSSFDQQKVLNASMKASRMLAQTYFIKKDENLKSDILASVQFVVNQQQSNGAFEYSDKRSKIDSYHTAYILDCLDEIQNCLTITTFDEQIKKGLDFYVSSFFTEKGEPKFYNDSIFPIDCTAAGQALLTLSRFKKFELAQNVADYMCSAMQHQVGYFYFRKYNFWTNKTSFMRWSNAWMFVGLSKLLLCKNNS